MGYWRGTAKRLEERSGKRGLDAPYRRVKEETSATGPQGLSVA